MPLSSADHDQCSVARPEWHTFVMASLALATALFSVVVDGPSLALVGFLAIGLIPWALVVSGVRMPLWLFVVATLVPTAFAVATPAPGPIFFGMITVLFVTSQTRNRSLTALTVGGALFLPLLCTLTNDDIDATGNWYFAAGILFAWFAGHMLLRQYQLVADLREAQVRVSALAAADERRRIAREIHDIVAHSLTVVVLNVGGARKAMTADPEAAAEALQRAEEVGRQALDDIRRTVGLLRDDEPSNGRPHTAAAPTAVAIPALIEGYRAAGMLVEADVDAAIADLDPVTGSILYRFVQEALANVLVHAPGAPASLQVHVNARSLHATVRNPAPGDEHATDGTREGLGLVGMRERIESRQGTFRAGLEGAEWLVACSLPIAPLRHRVER